MTCFRKRQQKSRAEISLIRLLAQVGYTRMLYAMREPLQVKMRKQQRHSSRRRPARRIYRRSPIGMTAGRRHAMRMQLLQLGNTSSVKCHDNTTISCTGISSRATRAPYRAPTSADFRPWLAEKTLKIACAPVSRPMSLLRLLPGTAIQKSRRIPGHQRHISLPPACAPCPSRICDARRLLCLSRRRARLTASAAFATARHQYATTDAIMDTARLCASRRALLIFYLIPTAFMLPNNARRFYFWSNYSRFLHARRHQSSLTRAHCTNSLAFASMALKNILSLHHAEQLADRHE